MVRKLRSNNILGVIEMKLTVCIPSFNRPFELERAIDSVLDYDVNVIVRDNHSPREREIFNILSKYKTRTNFKYLTSDKNNGYDLNLWRLIQEAKTPYTMFLGDDDVVIGESIDYLLEFL